MMKNSKSKNVWRASLRWRRGDDAAESGTGRATPSQNAKLIRVHPCSSVVLSFCLFAICLVSGCAHVDAGTTVEVVPAEQQSANPFQRAEELEQQGRYKQAMMQYASIQAAATSLSDVAVARTGRARCLLKLQQPDAAIALLSDLPDDPTTLAEAEQMAIVGEAFLRKERPQHAESLLEVALSVPKHDTAPWAAPAMADLAVAYLYSGKIDKAVVAYRNAAALFETTGRKEQAGECRETAHLLCRNDSSDARLSQTNFELKTGDHRFYKKELP